MSRITNPFIVAVDSPTTSSATGSVNVITVFHNTSSFSSSITSGAIATIGVDITKVEEGVGSTGEMFFRIADSDNLNTTGSKLLTLSYTGSNNEPRVGIGFDPGEKPIKPLDVKAKSDSSQGSEFILRSARLLKGGEGGDSAGKIDFVIDSASYSKNLLASGSVATIEGVVDDIDEVGTTGDLVFSVAATKDEAPIQRIRIQGESNTTEITGSADISADLDVGRDLDVDRSASLEHLTVGQGTYPSLQVFHEGADASPADKYVFARNLYCGITFTSGYTDAYTFAVGSGNAKFFSNVINLGNSSTDKTFVSGTLDVEETLYTSISFNSDIGDAPVVVYDTASRQFFYTGSYIVTGSQGAQGLQGAQGIRGFKGEPGFGVQGPQGLQGPAGLEGATNISASGYISASEAWIENDLAIGGIANVSASIYAAAQSGGGGSTPTLQEVTDEGASTTTAITSSIISSSNTVSAKLLQIRQSGGDPADGSIYFGTGPADNNAVIYDDGTDLQLGYNDTDVLTLNNNRVKIQGPLESNTYGVVSQSGDFITNEFIVAASPYSVTSSDALAVNSDGDLGIGTPNPEVRLHMLGEAPQTTQILMEQFNDTADAPDIRTRRYRGTSASRADVQTGDYLFRLNVHGQDGGASELYGSMRFDVDGTDQDAMVWGLQTRDTGGTVADRITIDSSGDVDVAGDLAINGITNVSASIASASEGGGAVATYTNGTDNRVITSTGTDGINGEANLTFDGTTLTVRGEQEFQPAAEIRGIHYDVDSNWESTTYVSSGEYITVGTAISRTAHDLYVLGSSGWVQADADALSTSTGLLGVAVDGSSGNDFLVKGVFNVTGTVYGSPAIGDTVYVHTIAGAYTVLAPTATGDVVRAIGHIVDSFTSGRNTYWKIFFNPSPDFIEN